MVVDDDVDDVKILLREMKNFFVAGRTKKTSTIGGSFYASLVSDEETMTATPQWKT
jgi:hypothetical protein